MRDGAVAGAPRADGGAPAYGTTTIPNGAVPAGKVGVLRGLTWPSAPMEKPATQLPETLAT